LKKFLSTVVFLLLANSASAQSCPAQPANFATIELITNPVVFDYSKTSNQIRSISNNEHLLGLYVAKRRFMIQPMLKASKTNNSNMWCGVVDSLKLSIILEPVIYISREAQQFPCTLKRVQEHEMTHHNFEIRSQVQSQAFLENIIRTKYRSTFNFYSETDGKNYLNNLNQKAVEEITRFYDKNSEALHAQIDTQENYRQESLMCSGEENLQLIRLLQQRN